MEYLATYIQTVSEHHRSARELVHTKVFFELGLTDAGLVDLAYTENLVLITADLRLYHYASGLGVKSINFNHLREAWLV